MEDVRFEAASEVPASAIEDRALLHLLAALREAGYRFTTPTPATHARVNARPDNAQARDLRGVFGWSRPFEPALLPDRFLKLMKDADILDEGGALPRSRIRVSSLDHELFAHSAYPTTSADAVFLGPDTYRFALAIQAALRDRKTPVRRAVDVGCGAGPGAIVVAKAYPQAQVVMGDINDTALRYARINATAARLPNAAACRSDLLSNVKGAFDLIVSNPPYLNDPLARAYRHGGGAFGAGLSARILHAALDRLEPGGALVLYTGSAIVDGRDLFFEEAVDHLRKGDVDWRYRELDPDVFGEELETDAYRDAERIAAVLLTVTKKGV